MKDKFVTKDGGAVAMADQGVVRMGCNPFGFGCPDCGASFSFAYKVLVEERSGVYELDGQELLLLDLNVKRDEVETERLRTHLGVQDVDKDLLAISEYLDQVLNVVQEEGAPPAKLREKVEVLVGILGRHREVLANYQATMQHVVKGMTVARDAVVSEIEAQRLLAVIQHSPYLAIALDALNTMIPGEAKKSEEKKVILLNGGKA